MMSSTTTAAYYYHHDPSSSSSKSANNNSNYSKYLGNNNYSSTGTSGTSSSTLPRKYFSNSSTNSSISSSSSASSYKSNRSSYDLNSTYRPSTYSSSSSSSSSSSYSTYTPNLSSFKSSYSPSSSSYLSKYSSGSSFSSSSGYGSSSSASSHCPVTLTKFSSRRSSFDYDDSTTTSNTVNNKTQSKNPVAGLTNLGNTCYMNSVLQALFATKKLRDFLLTGYESGSLYSALSKLFKEMSTSVRYGFVNPSTFRTTFIQIEPKFRGYNQQDAQEFLSYLTNDLHDEQNKAKSRSKCGAGIVEPRSAIDAWNIYRERFNDSKFVELFVGQFSSVIKCTDCGNESTCWDPFWDISLPVPRYRSRVDIEECLAEFTAAETLDGNEQPFCSKCKQHRKSTKRLSIVRSPKILVIHLKKFSNDGFKLSSDIVVNERIKIYDNNDDNNDYHQFNDHNSRSTTNSTTTNCLNRTQNGAGKSTIYELYACVCHHGFSSRSGHYTAYCQYDSKWFHCNDENVKEVTDTFSMATLKDAYVLLYRIQDSSLSSSSSSTTSSYLSSKYSSRL